MHMEICTHWNASGLNSKQEYLDFFHFPPQPAPDFLPPSINDLDDVLNARKPFIRRNIDRTVLVEELRKSHQQRNAPESCYRSLDELLDSNTYLVISGQQPGIFGGPLYTFYKIIHTVTLARDLNKSRKEHFVPAFWNASEDHDFDEISRLHWLNKEKRLEEYVCPPPDEEPRPYFEYSTSDIPLHSILQMIQETTHPSLFKREIIDLMYTCIDEVDTYPDVFDRILWSLFPGEGMLIIRPENRFLRQESIRILEREIETPSHSSQVLELARQQVKSNGLKPQIHKRIDRTSFFRIHNGRRRLCTITPNGIEEDGTGSVKAPAQMQSELSQNPETFSPSAILRPVVQDAVFPTALAVLGPSEMAYHFLLQEIYEFHEVPRPAVVPRFSITLVEPKERKLLENYKLQPSDLQKNPAYPAKQLIKQNLSEYLLQTKELTENYVRRYYNDLIHETELVEPSIKPVLKKYEKQVHQIIEQSEALFIRRQAQRNEQIHTQIYKLRDSLVPKGDLQERTLSILHFLIHYGFPFLENLKELSTQMKPGQHYYVQLH